MPAKTSKTPAASFQVLLTTISDRTRWRILREILKEPMHSAGLAVRFGMTHNSISKHMRRLCASGVVRCGHGNVYHIVTDYIIPGTSSLDLGAVVIHLDQQPD